jgi:hypothetical protein
MNAHMQQVAQGVHQNMPFVPFHFLAPINAPLFTGILGFDALCINDGIAWHRLFACPFTAQPVDRI